MDLFDKATNIAKNVGSTIYNTTKEQGELAGLNVQLSVIEKKLAEDYAEIGRRYVAYIENCETDDVFDVNDVVERMKPSLEKKADLLSQIAVKEQEIRARSDERNRKKAQAEFDAYKKKLDKALELDVISEEDYERKIACAQKKLDNYNVLRRIEMQYEMGIITKEECDEKVRDILA